MGVIPMAFYAVVNLIALLAEGLWILFGKPGIVRQAKIGKKDVTLSKTEMKINGEAKQM